MQVDGVDETDQLPVWRCVPGETRLGDCTVVERLGTGHRTETWLGWSSRLWCPVVLKLTRPGQTHHPRALATLRREVEALAGVTHPALPRMVDAHLDHEVPHVVLEYLDGPTLDELVDERGALPSHEVALIGAQLLPALATLHARGVAHLDIKPENVVVRAGHPVLIDFGSSRPIGNRQPSGRPVGTMGYAAPEMEACAPISAAMDLFGLGTVLAEAASGVPFPDGGRLPRSRLASVVRQLVSVDPADRGSAPELLAVLAEACGRARPWPTWLDPRSPGSLAVLFSSGGL